MNSSLEPPRTVVFALCGSFCTFETVLPQIIRLRACGWEVLPMLSYAASALDTRFGRAADWKQRLEEATGHRPLEDLREAEPLGPKHMAQALVIAPCTGTTMALLAAGISATPVTLAAKSMLRGGRPVVIGVSTNDGLSGSVGALAALLQHQLLPSGIAINLCQEAALMRMTASTLNDDHLLLVLATAEASTVLQSATLQARTQGVTIIALTPEQHALADMASAVLPLPANPQHARYALLLLVDLLNDTLIA